MSVFPYYRKVEGNLNSKGKPWPPNQRKMGELRFRGSVRYTTALHQAHPTHCDVDKGESEAQCFWVLTGFFTNAGPWAVRSQVLVLDLCIHSLPS